MTLLALLVLLWAPASARDRATVVETPNLSVPLSGPAVPEANIPRDVAAVGGALSVVPELPAAAAAGEAAAGIQVPPKAAEQQGKTRPQEQGDGASLDDYLAGRQRFDNDEGFSNLFAAAQRATPAEKAYVDAMISKVKGRPLYIDNNTMVFAMNGQRVWLYFFNQVPRVDVVPQVYNERQVSDESVLRSVAKKKDGADAQAEAGRLSSIFRRRERRLMRYMGARLRKAPPVDEADIDALAGFLRSNISQKDSRVVAEIALSCRADPCYFLTHDDKLADALQKLRDKPFQSKLDKFLAERPGFPRPRWPSVLPNKP